MTRLAIMTKLHYWGDVMCFFGDIVINHGDRLRLNVGGVYRLFCPTDKSFFVTMKCALAWSNFRTQINQSPYFWAKMPSKNKTIRVNLKNIKNRFNHNLPATFLCFKVIRLYQAMTSRTLPYNNNCVYSCYASQNSLLS